MLGKNSQETPERGRFRELQRQMSESKLLTHSGMKSIAVSFLNEHRKEVGIHDITMEDMLFGAKEEKKNTARFSSMVMNVMRSLDPCLSSEEILSSRRAPPAQRRSSLGAVSSAVSSSQKQDDTTNCHNRGRFSSIVSKDKSMSRCTLSPTPVQDMSINLAPRRGEWGRSHAHLTHRASRTRRSRSLEHVISSPSSAGERSPPNNIVYDDTGGYGQHQHVPRRHSMSGLLTSGIMSALTEEEVADDDHY
jgi:hypothetical protein